MTADSTLQSIYADAGAVSLALAPDAPLFLFSAAALIERATRFLAHFPGRVTYAVKCNPTEHVLQTLSNVGICAFDVASVQEIDLLRRVAPDARLHYHNPVKSRREIETAYRVHGCRRFAVDCHEEIVKLHAVIGGDPSVELAVRFVLPRERGSAAHDFSTKFGAPEHICADLLKQAQALGYAPLLTFHPGSQVHDVLVYVRHIEAAARIAYAAGIFIPVLNVGGGFPANYVLSSAPEPETFFAAIEEAAAKAFGANPPALECEPGRGLVAGCMSILARVKLVCDTDDIFLNDGVYGGLMEYMQAPDLRPPFRLWRGGQEVGGPTKSFKLFGPTCDPLDELPHRFDVSESVREDDYIEFGMSGAYGPACLTKFNGYGGHEIVAVDRVLSL